MKSAQIGIIGCAIAGLSAALGVAKAGHRAVIFGQPHHNLAGALQLAPNGFAALETLNCLAEMTPHLTRLHAIEIRSARTNACLSIIDHDAPHHRDYGAIGRGALVTQLYQLAKAHDLISFCDDSVESITSTEQETSLITTAHETYHFDLIIGADGQNGIARAFVGSANNAQHITRQALRACLRATDVPQSFSANRTQLWLGDGYHLVSYPYHDPHADTRMINLVLCTDKSLADPSKIAASLLGTKPVLAPLCDADIAWHAAALPPANQLSSWRRHSVVLIGDAAHFMPPHLAQGAGQTLEDAAQLALALKDATDIREAARKWALTRQQSLRPIIEKAEATGTIMRLKGPLALIRNAAVELGGQRLVEKWLSRVWQ